ncbi:DNA photolyase [Roseobacter sp. YSTF-M11]|uniref:DNA photolyase n=1 Tax=Roseobacter insulae TaxID=2859783 RepID=A0A9X1FYX5_9RHOB|nr:FAD-binding domain-containing protein [Roseobacter insulae]MBW4710163.1 DNA photolyase [Roseobacter insulae]
MTALDLFPPTRTAALERLSAFVPKAGRAYAARRNYDHGPGQHGDVSTLSPYVRCRLITEAEILTAVLGRHSEKSAEKFIQEVFWRTYWKGWLERRPTVWEAYQHDLRQAWDAVQSQTGLRDRWTCACLGNTDIECFNNWAQELVSMGYLHNHARMWFASIWVFTLELPWQLGADFFLRHLLDGDPACNTLSWRWVAGLQTVGKTYQARADNIAKYTNGRFRPRGQLAQTAAPRSGQPVPPPQALRALPPVDRGLKTGLLLHHDDLSPGYVFDQAAPVSLCHVAVENGISPLLPAPHVGDFRTAATRDSVARYQHRVDTVTEARSLDDILSWAARERLGQIVMTEPPVGPVAAFMDRLATHPDAPLLRPLRRPYDQAAWPHATTGFFGFRKAIPDLIARLN